MSALNLRLPNSVHRHIKDISAHEGVSINQFILSAVSEKISAVMTEEYIEKRGRKARKGAFKRILSRVPRRAPLPGDERPGRR